MIAIRHSARFALVLAVVTLGFIALNHLASGSTYNPRNTVSLSNNAASASPTRTDYTEWLSPDANFSLAVTFLPGGWCIATMADDCSTTGAGPDGSYSPTGSSVDVGSQTTSLVSAASLAITNLGGLFINNVCSVPFAPSFTMYAGVTSAGSDKSVIDGSVDMSGNGTIGTEDDGIIECYITGSSAGISAIDGKLDM